MMGFKDNYQCLELNPEAYWRSVQLVEQKGHMCWITSPHFASAEASKWSSKTDPKIATIVILENGYVLYQFKGLHFSSEYLQTVERVIFIIFSMIFLVYSQNQLFKYCLHGANLARSYKLLVMKRAVIINGVGIRWYPLPFGLPLSALRYG